MLRFLDDGRPATETMRPQSPFLTAQRDRANRFCDFHVCQTQIFFWQPDELTERKTVIFKSYSSNAITTIGYILIMSFKT